MLGKKQKATLDRFHADHVKAGHRVVFNVGVYRCNFSAWINGVHIGMRGVRGIPCTWLRLMSKGSVTATGFQHVSTVTVPIEDHPYGYPRGDTGWYYATDLIKVDAEIVERSKFGISESSIEDEIGEAGIKKSFPVILKATFGGRIEPSPIDFDDFLVE